MFELQARYDNHKSFYGKAQVDTMYTPAFSVYELYSYGTRVARLRVYHLGDVKQEIEIIGFYSNTTVRHIKEFLYQFSSIELGITKKELEVYLIG